MVENVYTQWKKTGYAWEQYDSVTGQGQRTAHFLGWTSLVVNLMNMPEKVVVVPTPEVKMVKEQVVVETAKEEVVVESVEKTIDGKAKEEVVKEVKDAEEEVVEPLEPVQPVDIEEAEEAAQEIVKDEL